MAILREVLVELGSAAHKAGTDLTFRLIFDGNPTRAEIVQAGHDPRVRDELKARGWGDECLHGSFASVGHIGSLTLTRR